MKMRKVFVVLLAVLLIGSTQLSKSVVNAETISEASTMSLRPIVDVISVKQQLSILDASISFQEVYIQTLQVKLVMDVSKLFQKDSVI